MGKIDSIYEGKIVSEHNAPKITSKVVSHVQSKTNLNILSDAEIDTEKAAFLTTAKRNASIMFAKYL